MDGQQEITKELCCQVVNKEVCSSHNDLTTRLWTPHYWCQLLMDTNNPAKIKGMTATGRRVDQASLLCRWLPFTAAWSGGQHRSMPPAEHWSIPNMPCMHRLKSLSWALENSYTVCQWILPKLKVREKKKKSTAFCCEMDQGKARLLTPEESPISLLGCNPSEQMGSTSRGSRQI